MKHLFPIIGLLLLFINTTFSQTDSLLIQSIGQNKYPFKFEETFEGLGWEKIVEASGKHKYFLIGEDHGFAEIPIFCQALAKNVKFNLFVTEIDSIAASIAEEIAHSSEKERSIFHKNHPSSLSFFSAKEEFDLLIDLVTQGADIWGLDQVSLFSSGIAFDELYKHSESAEAKSLAKKYAKLSNDLFIEAVNTANYDTLFLYSSKQAVFDELATAYQQESNQAQAILSDIQSSWEIYNGINNANYYTRIAGMKQKLLNYYLDTHLQNKQYQKVLFKFGAYHLFKGENPFGGFDVGNFTNNIAEAEGSSSYHLLVIGKSGEMNTFIPTEGMNVATFTIEDNNSPLHGLMPFANQINNDNWMFFDLQSIRSDIKKNKIPIEESFLKRVLDGYDGLVIIPSVSASILYQE